MSVCALWLSCSSSPSVSLQPQRESPPQAHLNLCSKITICMYNCSCTLIFSLTTESRPMHKVTNPNILTPQMSDDDQVHSRLTRLYDIELHINFYLLLVSIFFWLTIESP